MVVAARRSSEAILSADLAEVLAYLGMVGLSESASRSIKRIHKLTFSLVLWRYCVKGMSGHAKVFVDELASDALHVIPLVARGFRKPTLLALRGILEASLRHIYFADHPVEFWRSNNETWFIEPRELFDYARAHPVLGPAEERFDAIARARALYRELSSSVHGEAVKSMQLNKSLAALRPSEALLDYVATLTARTVVTANFLLAVFQAVRFSRMAPEHRQIIVMTLPKAARRVISGAT